MGARVEKVYLGDGVFAEFDGWYLVLTAEDGIRVTNIIYLEPDVLDSLDTYRERLKEPDGNEDH